MHFNLEKNEFTVITSKGAEGIQCPNSAVLFFPVLRSLDSPSTLGNHCSNFICLQIESHDKCQ